MKSKFSFLYIYLTDRCNLGCIHCWQSAPLEGTGKYSSLKFDECKKFLDDAVAMGLENITFSGGEPLLNPEFHRFVEYFYKNSIRMTVETNGMLIGNKDIFDTIRKYRVYCAVSLDGVNPETHNKHRGNNKAFNRTLKNLYKLEQEKIGFQLIMAISKFNYHELVPLLDVVNEKFKMCNTFKINIVNSLGRAGEMERDGLLFEAEELPALSEEISALIDRYPIISLHVDPAFVAFKNFSLKFSCGGYCGYNSGLSILANGNISICSLGKQTEKYLFGHIATIDLKDVWENNPFLVENHDNIHTRLKGICSNCIFRKRCLGGCRAEALCAYDDFLAPAPRCQAYYDSGNFPGSKLIDPARSSRYPG